LIFIRFYIIAMIRFFSSILGYYFLGSGFDSAGVCGDFWTIGIHPSH
jgi:hypothetical protein